MTLYKHEMKINLKTLLIWAFSVGGMCFFCILLFDSMKSEMSGMAESFANMGAFSEAFGMNQLSIASLEGYYATEIGTIHSLGGAMFAAIVGTVMLSKEEDNHTEEFLYTMPIKRTSVVVFKGIALISSVVIFNIICIVMYLTGFLILGESISAKEFIIYHLLQLLMHIEVAGICYFISAISKKNRLGLGLGIAILLYAFDLIARVVPALENINFITPFSYANAADIFSKASTDKTGLIIGVLVFILSVIGSVTIYNKRDLGV